MSAPGTSSILFVSDHPAGGLRCLLSEEENGRLVTCPAREVCGNLGCLRSVGWIILSMDSVSGEEIVAITDRARETSVPVLMI